MIEFARLKNRMTARAEAWRLRVPRGPASPGPKSTAILLPLAKSSPVPPAIVLVPNRRNA